jgi:hypothetical protein
MDDLVIEVTGIQLQHSNYKMGLLSQSWVPAIYTFQQFIFIPPSKLSNV